MQRLSCRSLYIATFPIGILVGLQIFFAGCTIDSAKNHYVLAEKLWTDQKYGAAVAEFNKVIAKDPHGKLGLQALFRAAMTQTLFLSQYDDAVRKFKEYADTSKDEASVWEAEVQIGEILFSKVEQYDQAIVLYQNLIRQRPKAPEVPEFQFRIARSHFFQSQFDAALKEFQDIATQYPRTIWAERADYQIGDTYFTRGEQLSEEKGRGTEMYEAAQRSYEKFLKKYPKSALVPDAQFGLASCLEETDQLDEAYEAFEALKSTYPSPSVVEVKLIRIRERKSQRNH